VLTPRRQLAVLARPECLRLVVAGQRDFAAQHHDARVKVVRVQLLGEVALLTAMHDLEALAAQVAFERLAGERSSVAASARYQGNALRTHMLGVHATRRDLETLSRADLIAL
jgi:hypothetical protein